MWHLKNFWYDRWCHVKNVLLPEEELEEWGSTTHLVSLSATYFMSSSFVYSFSQAQLMNEWMKKNPEGRRKNGETLGRIQHSETNKYMRIKNWEFHVALKNPFPGLTDFSLSELQVSIKLCLLPFICASNVSTFQMHYLSDGWSIGQCRI